MREDISKKSNVKQTWLLPRGNHTLVLELLELHIRIPYLHVSVSVAPCVAIEVEELVAELLALQREICSLNQTDNRQIADSSITVTTVAKASCWSTKMLSKHQQPKRDA
jgi:hypothetical protein